MEVKQAIQEMVDMIQQGKAMDAFEKFYAENVVMQENQEAPREGKTTNREYEEKFFGNVADVHEIKAHTIAVEGNKSMVEWTFDVTMKDGNRMKMEQVAVQTWENDQIIRERFYYNKPSQ